EASVGDVTGDGFDDIVLGLQESNHVAVMFGQGGANEPAVIQESDLSGPLGGVGMELSGNGFFGYSVSAAGDFNGDGIQDLLVGAPLSVNGNDGAAYVIFGHALNDLSWVTTPPSALDGTNGFVMTQTHAPDFGHLLSALGDVNGDGIDDF